MQTTKVKNLANFWCFINFSFNHKWNKAWFLAINMVHKVASQAANDWRLRILGNQEMSERSQKSYCTVALCPALLPKWQFCQYYRKTAEKQKLNFSCKALFHMKIRVSQIFSPWLFLQTHFCLYLALCPFKFDLLPNCGNSKAFNTVLTNN